ncbi:replication-relaxation family protein [Cellulosilyticum sp. I15G10I2]|uniref:replication-relaxation family protein n=1 Tax=Cellulosilyticum sp. I15G10I2 TaxID=1892843 RepID=UPI00085C9D9B|nr:replication-relaxation family protein [Cellulosilyticum sp. I15G10I2]
MSKIKLMPRDFLVLEGIYKYECLSWDQVYDLFFKHGENGKINSSEYMRKRLSYLCNKDYLEAVVIKDGRKVYFLKQLGIKEYRSHFKIVPDITDAKTGKLKRNYYRACELKKHPVLLPHQLKLIDFIIKAKAINSNYSHIMNKGFETKYRLMPDACLITNSFELFLEQDMDTERKKKLENKIAQYRHFFSNHFSENMALFFIINSKYPEKRAKLFGEILTIYMLDMFKDNFDAYIGTEDTLIEVLKYFNNKISIIYMQLKSIEKISVSKFGKIEDIYISQKFDFIIVKEETVFCIHYFIANRMSCFYNAFLFDNFKVAFNQVYPQYNIVYLMLYDSSLEAFQLMFTSIKTSFKYSKSNIHAMSIDNLIEYFST